MAMIFNDSNIEYERDQSVIPEFAWLVSKNVSKMTNARNLVVDVRILEPSKYSYPYHSHRNAEELFIILEGQGRLRTPKGIEVVKKGDIIFFELESDGAHQLHNDQDQNLKYIDIRTNLGMDVCDYPDSGKINVLPYYEIYESNTKVNYYKGEEHVATKW